MEKKEEMEECIVRTWGKLLNTEGEATLNIEKERHQMEDEGEITREEFDRAVRRVKVGKAVDEEGISGEFSSQHIHHYTLYSIEYYVKNAWL